MRLSFKATISSDEQKVAKAADEALYKELVVSGRNIVRLARRGMKSGWRGRKYVPSAPGTPPHVKSGNLKRHVMYAVVNGRNGPELIVGTDPEAWYGIVHEMGGRNHPKRPWLRPAWRKEMKNLPRRLQDKLRYTKAARELMSRYGNRGD